MDNILSQKYGKKLATHSIEVNLKDTSGKYYLPDDSILRDKRVVGVAIMDNTNGDAKSPLQKDIVSPAVIRSSFLSLVDVNDHIIDNHPLVDMMVTTTDKSWLLLDLDRINPSKSFIECGNPGVLKANESYLFQFAYINE